MLLRKGYLIPQSAVMNEPGTKTTDDQKVKAAETPVL
jgi:hypothetical protein